MLKISKLFAFMILLVLSHPLSAVKPSSVQAPSKPVGPTPPNKYGPGYVSGKAIRSCPKGDLKPVFIPDILSIAELVDDSPDINNRVPHIVMVIDPMGQVIDTRFTFNRGSGDPVVDEEIVIWAKQFIFEADKCKIRRLRFVEQPVVLYQEDEP